jgi:hypothetical protein
MKHPGGGWEGKKEGSQRASVVRETKYEAEKAMKEILKNQGGGELRIHNLKNVIIDSDTVAPAKDPNPPKDTVY